MAPGRRRGANRAAARSQLKLGDLVLAKVKGFPPWPAKISKPEDWKRHPDSKKYFVKFFGTNEIAFIAPADVQAFTDEVKNKLLSRGPSKANCFAEAVKEICAAFDELNKPNSSCLQDDTDGSDFGSSIPIVDGVDDNGMEEDLKDGIVTVESNQAMNDDFGGGFPNFLQSEDEVNDGYDVKPKIEFHPNHVSSPVLSSEKGKKKYEGTDDKSENSSPNSSQLKEELSVTNRQKSLNKSGQKSEMIGSGAKRKSGEAVELNESNSSSVVASKDDNSVGSPEKPESSSRLKDGIKGKVISEAIDRGDFVSDLKSDSKNGGCEKSKDMVKGKNSSKVKNEPRREIKEEHYVRKRRVQPGEGKPALETNDNMPQAKKMKSEELGDGQTSQHKSKKMVSGSSNIADNHEAKTPEFKKYSSRAKSESTFNVRSTTGTGTSNVSDDKELLSQFSVGQLQQTSVAIVDGKKNNKSLTEKKHAPHNSTVRVPAKQLRKKRRAVCLFDDDEDEEPKTPVHGASAINVIVPDDTKKTAAQDVSSNHTEQNVKETSISKDSHLKESLHLPIKRQTQRLKKKDNAVEKLMAGSVSRGVEKLESEQLTLKTPKKSPEFEIDAKQVVEEGNVPKFPVNISRPASQKKAHTLSSKGTEERSLKSPQVQAKNQLNRPASSAERSKSIPKSLNRVHEYAEPAEMSSENNHFSGSKGTEERSLKSPQVQAKNQLNRPASSAERSKSISKSLNRVHEYAEPAEMSSENNHFSGRMEAVREDKRRSVIVSKTSDSGTSMKHLIAAAQAKRRLTHSQSTSLGIFDTAIFSLTDMQEHSPSPSLVQPFLPSTSSMEHTNLRGSYQLSDLPSLPINDHPLTSPHQSYIGELEVGRASPINKAAGDALSDDTDASVARDAFEGMIETLSRTKESIGRATRLAIDCAKHGIANEVVELLIRKLETETIVQRKVDLFFLVDSITQCSHSQRGIAGAFYIPIVQTALSRLLGAAAPPGAHARENRRQCHKVLRLWLERKILPESVVRRHIEELGVSNDDSTVSFSLRRPARAERSVDDPIREMEGMLVDEYGSNATFQLPGFLSSRVFEDDDEDFEQKSPKEKGKASPMSPTWCANDLEACAVTPSDRRHFILEDVDGELEMEDVSGQPKDAKPLVRNISLEMSSHHGLEKSMEHIELPPLPENSPPLPLDSPPPLPPLPPSPPPPLPPHPLSPSSPQPPPPPPPPSLLLQPPCPLPTPGPLISQQLEPTHPMIPPPQILPPQSSMQSSQKLAYQVPVPLEYCSTSIVQGNQLVQMGNLSHGGQVDASVKSERFQQQSPCFVPTGTCTSREPSGFNSSRQLEYGHSDMYLNTQLSRPNQPFQQVNTPFVQGPPQPAPPLNPSSHFSFQGAAPHQPPHPYGPYSMPCHPDSRRQFSGDGQWRMPSGEFKAENHSLWMNGGRTPSYTGPPFGQEGYYRPPYERPPSNSVSFQQTVPNNLPPGAPISAHSVPQILPSRPDISTVNCWRQA